MAEEEKILVVEDNDFVRMQIVKYLQDDGYETVEASDGEQALEIVRKDIALAIVDVRMEPIGGFEFIRAIRGQRNETPVILVTGDQNPDLLNEAGKWDVGAVLIKPVQKDRLLKMVGRILRSSKRQP